MKKFKKLIATVALTLSAVLLFASCGTATEPAIYGENKAAHVYTKAEQLSEFTGFSNSQDSEDFALFTKTETTSSSTGSQSVKYYKVYNKANGKVWSVSANSSSYTGSSTQTTITYELYEGYFIEKKVTTNTTTSPTYSTSTTTELKLINYDMSVVVSKTASNTDAPIAHGEYNGLYYIGNDYYRTENNKTSLAFNAEMKELPLVVKSIVKEYVLVEDDNSNRYFVYDKNYNLLSNFEVPAYAEAESVHLFDNGNVLFQYTYMVDPYSSDYDVYDTSSGNKINVETKLFDLEKNKVQEIKTDLIIDYVYNASYATENDIVIAESFKDYQALMIATSKIENGRIVEVTACMLGVTDSGKITEVPAIIENQAMFNTPIKLKSGKYLVSTLDGQAYIVDPADKEATPKQIKLDDYNNKYFILDGAVYSLSNLKKVDMTNGYTVERIYDDTIILSKYVKEYVGNSSVQQDVLYYYLFDGSNVRQIGKASQVELFDNFYTVLVNPMQVALNSTTYTYTLEIHKSNGDVISGASISQVTGVGENAVYDADNKVAIIAVYTRVPGTTANTYVTQTNYVKVS